LSKLGVVQASIGQGQHAHVQFQGTGQDLSK